MGTAEIQEEIGPKFIKRSVEFVMLSTEDKKDKVWRYLDPGIVGNVALAVALGFCPRAGAIKFLRGWAQRAKDERVGLTWMFFEDLCRKHGI